MPVIQGRTREELRQHVGYALGAVYVSSASTNGTTTTLVDNTLVLGGADNHIGKWVRLTSGDDDGAIRRVTDSSVSSNVATLTLMPALSASSTSGIPMSYGTGIITQRLLITLSTSRSSGQRAMPMIR